MADYKMIPDADLSNAGDDFHILWTIKKSLELLNFDNQGLKAITIEGIEENLSKKIDPYGEKFLGIDLTEYFGGNNFESAESIVISQLKYSTRRASENFTFSKLYEGKKSKSYNGSIIHRLATIFKTFLDEFGRDEVIKKIKIKLVSNRNINTSHLKQITQAQEYLARNKRALSFNSVLKEFPAISKESFDKLRKASGLNLIDFTDFVRLLDFEECGTSSRKLLELELIKSISNTSIKSQNEYNSLFKMIWDKMMPEQHQRTITFIDVVANFGFSSIENLFPVSQNFENNPNTIQREQLNEILSVIEGNTSYLPICIHGGAGIGKSTIVNQIKNTLPEYSECILFDCYGAGKYQNPEDKRHLHRNAIIQLANELAKKVGTEFLLVQNESDDIYLKELIKRIRDGVEILRNRNPLAYLIIIIDAADNSITAAKNNGEKSFVEELVNIEIPDGCHIIVTSRSYRKESLNLPDKYTDVELKPFSLEETKLFAKKSFPSIADEEITEFHQYTKGIPRVQFYSLNLKNQGINEIINYLKPNGKGVGDLILDKIEHAIIRIGKDKKPLVGQFFKLLISLPRPVPISYLSEIMEVKVDFLKDLSFDIWNGLRLEDDLFSFRDEDFENYIRETYKITLEELQQIAQIFLSKSETDEYASINLGSLLFTADYKKELVDIVLNRKLLTFPKDPIRNREVYINRTKLALKVSYDIQDDLTYFKLLFIAAEESKTDKALTELLINYPDLVSRFGDEASLSRLKLKSEEKPWAGAFHLKLAGIYSRKPESREIALKHLKTSHEWLNWRSQKKDEELKDYHISSLDISYEVETVLRLFGLDRAIKTINRWNPKETRLSAGNYLVENIISFSTKENIDEWLKYPKFRVDVKLFIICKLFQYNQPISFDLNFIATHLLSILRKKQIKFNKRFQQLIIQFCGILAHHKVDSEIILNILNFITTKPLDRIPYFYNDYSNEKEEIVMNITLAKETLVFSLQNEEANIEYFYPDRFKNIDKVEDYEKRNSLDRDKKEFVHFYKYAVPIYQLRSDLLTERFSQSECLTKFEEICSNIGKDYDFKYQFGYWANDRFIFLSGKLTEIALLFDDKAKSIDFIINSLDSQTDKLKLRFEILDKIILLKDLLKTSFRLLSESDKIINDSELSSKEIVENYIRCLLLSSKINDSFSKDFFDKAIKATSEIDYEAFMQILSIYYLSETGVAKPNPQLAYEYARFIEYCDIKLGAYDKKHFPYSEGLLGIANIDMPSMFATICRWHHRNIVKVGRRINSLIKKALEKGYIDHIIAGSLLNLKTDYNYEELEQFYKLLIQKFNESGNSELKSRFIQLEFRDLRLNNDKHFTRKIYDEIKTGKFIDSNVVSEIKNYIDFLDTLENKKSYTDENNSFKKEEFTHNIDLTKLDYTSTKEIEKAIDSIIMNNVDSYNHRRSIEYFLSEIINKCSSNEYTQFLDALVDVSDNLLDFNSFENIIKKAINEWDFYPEVKKWKQEKFKYILLTKLQHFDYGNTLSIWSLRQFTSLFNIDDSQLADIMVDILPQKIDLLSDESIYSSFELIKSKLSPSKNEELLVWILDKWNSKIKPEIADGYWVEELMPPINANENIAYLLRFILGHPDKKLRWRAIHSIRRLVNLNNVEILKVLLDKQNEKHCLPFQNKGYIYYWMSAKLYLWIAIDRISHENPEKLIPFKDIFYSELMDEELPHVLIRHYIKNSCLNLYNFDNSIYSEVEFQSIQEVNNTKLGYVEEKRYSREQRKYSTDSQENWKFKFDGLDTLPYWYNRVGNAFNLSEYDVADIADKFITEKWGYTGNPNKDDFIRGQLYDRDWYLTRNDHGSNPEIEDLSIYFEYHAMYCAANFLLEKEPLLETDSWYSWRHWLASEANAFDNFWLSDLRDPLPLKLEYWKNNIAKLDLEWRDVIQEECFDSSIGFLDERENKFLNLYGGVTKNIGANLESISISSCLVSNRGAEALLRALQTTKDSYDYSIPLEEDEDEYDKQTIEDNGFILKGWLIDVTSKYEGLDSDDPFFNKTDKGYIKFGKTVHTHFNIQYDNFYKHSYIDNQIISIYENWNEISDEEYRRYNTDIETSGSIFKVSSNFLLDFLKAEQKALIIRCIIERQLEERKYRDRNDDNRHRVKLYLIKPDGTVKTLRGRDYKIG